MDLSHKPSAETVILLHGGPEVPTPMDTVINLLKKKYHLLGHSWGGLYAQIYAQEFPEKVLSLFLSSPSSGTGYQWDETEDEVMDFNKSKTTF